MKNLFASALLFLCLTGKAQDPVIPINQAGKMELSEVVSDSADAATLFSRARLFTATYFKPAATTQVNDDKSHTLVVRTALPRYAWYALNKDIGGSVAIQVTIQCKDGRYRYAITDFIHSDHNRKGDYSGGPLENEKPACGTLIVPKAAWQRIKADARSKADSVITHLKQAMALTPTESW